jgi:adenosylmethionine-8-amino-7-oxononanoate aminotransferase
MIDHVWLPYSQMLTAPEPPVAARTEGCRIVLEDGTALVDGTSSWWTAAHGYNHPRITRAIRDQLEVMPHVMFGGLVHEPALQLAKTLCDMLPGDLERAFFVESGSVSVEVAMKMAIQTWMNRGRPEKQRFVSFKGGYHGDTFATMSVCDPEEGMHVRFQGALLEQRVVDLPADPDGFSTWLASVKDDTAAVIVEPLVQCAGGFRVHAPEVLQGIARACEESDVLLILDEIAVGFSRAGSMFACEQAGVVPDIITLGKALTGGTLPLAAAVARKHVFDAFLDDDPERALQHGPTYMANPLACAAASASLALFAEEPRVAQSLAIEAQLEDELEPCRALPGVVDVRVKGAIGCVELDRDATGMRAAFVERGVWVRPFGKYVYLMPPLVIARDDLSTLTRSIRDVLR